MTKRVNLDRIISILQHPVVLFLYHCSRLHKIIRARMIWNDCDFVMMQLPHHLSFSTSSFQVWTSFFR